MNKPQKHDVKWWKPDVKKYNSIYIKCPEKANLQMESRLVAAQGLIVSGHKGSLTLKCGDVFTTLYTY